MKNLEMENYGVEELNHTEMVGTDGGKDTFTYTYSGTSNGLLALGETVGNGVKFVLNTSISAGTAVAHAASGAWDWVTSKF
jgi:hypothetical protein